MVRFFAAPPDISGGAIQLSADDAVHIRSLRLRPSELFVVCDGEGSDYICRLGESGSAVAEIVEKRPSEGEPSIACSVYIALAKGDRLDYAVQKSVELGANEIILFPSARCVAIPGDVSNKTARLRRIALETAKQCGRGRVPNVEALGSLAEAIGRAAGAGLALFLYECEVKLSLKQALEGYDALSQIADPNPADAVRESHSRVTVSIMTGPEGGFEPFEAELAKAAGMLTVTLGSRILRCETAPAAALAALMFHTGNL